MENKRLFVAVRVARYLNPDRSAYAKVLQPLLRNLNCDLKSLEQRARRFENDHSGDRLSILNLASDLYAQFLCSVAFKKSRAPDQPVVMSEAESHLLWTAMDKDWRMKWTWNDDQQ